MPTKKELSLLPESDNYNSIQGRIVRWLTTVGRVVIILTELVVVSAFLSRFYLDRKNADLSEMLRQKKSILESTKEFEQQFNLLQSRLTFIKNFNSNSPQLSQRLISLTQSISPDITLENLNIDDADAEITKLTLSAYAPNQDSIVNFVTNLSLNPQVKNIEIASIEKKTKNNNFLIDLSLQLVSSKEVVSL